MAQQAPSSTDRSSILTELAALVVEAALEAEFAEHLEEPGLANGRNGRRSKWVRSVVGVVEIEVPRDRLGTFEPMTVGKWQRDVQGLDRVLLPVAARGATIEGIIELLERVYPRARRRVLHRIARNVRARLAHWHERPIDATYPVLRAQLSTLRTVPGRTIGPPVASVVGVGTTGGRDLLGLYSVPSRGERDVWDGILDDLHRRGLRGVVKIIGQQPSSLREDAARLWPQATVVAAG